MALLDLLKKSPDQVQDKQVQQLIAFAGGGKLIDDSDCSREFRAFLGSVPSSNLKDYADQCLNQTFTDSSLALQDIVNEIGARLGSDVTPGRYRGTSKHLGFGALWKYPNRNVSTRMRHFWAEFSVQLLGCIVLRSRLVDPHRL